MDNGRTMKKPQLLEEFRKPSESAGQTVAKAPAQQTKPAPVQQTKPAPVQQAKPAPVQQAKPAPVQQAKPAPVQQAKPAPVQQAQPAPVQQAQPALVQQAKPVPVQQAQPAPVQQAQPAPVQQAQPAPVQQIRAVPVRRVSGTRYCPVCGLPNAANATRCCKCARSFAGLSAVMQGEVVYAEVAEPLPVQTAEQKSVANYVPQESSASFVPQEGAASNVPKEKESDPKIIKKLRQNRYQSAVLMLIEWLLFSAMAVLPTVFDMMYGSDEGTVTEISLSFVQAVLWMFRSYTFAACAGIAFIVMLSRFVNAARYPFYNYGQAKQFAPEIFFIVMIVLSVVIKERVLGGINTGNVGMNDNMTTLLIAVLLISLMLSQLIFQKKKVPLSDYRKEIDEIRNSTKWVKEGVKRKPAVCAVFVAIALIAWIGISVLPLLSI